jgi:hypothetical protein
MSEHKNNTGPFHLILAVITAIIGHAIHGSLFWSIMDFLFYPIVIIKWLICQEINMSVLRRAFSWFFV